MPYSEEIIEGMLADLAANGAIPDSIKMVNEMAVTEIVNGALAPGVFTRAVLDFGVRPSERIGSPIILRSE